MSFVKIMAHCVWATKNRAPVLIKEKRQALIEFIRNNAKEKGIFIDCINGHNDHLHALISLGRKQNIADVTQQIKEAPHSGPIINQHYSLKGWNGRINISQFQSVHRNWKK